MALYKELLVRVKQDYPELRFREGVRFSYRPPRTVTYECFEEWGAENEQKNESSRRELVSEQKSDSSRLADSLQSVQNEQNYYNLQLLHEIGHAMSGHRDYKLDVERVKMECEAWEKARELAKKYGVEYDEEFVQDELDTYRDWLHQRSKCSKCGNTRYQDSSGKYHCALCENFN